MKQKILLIATVLSLVLIMNACGTNPSSASSTQTVDIERASEIALSHAEVSKENAEIKKVQLNASTNTYDVEFVSKSGASPITFTYTLDSKTGEVLSFSQTEPAPAAVTQSSESSTVPKEPASISSPAPKAESSAASSVSPAPTQSSSAGSGEITLDQAKKIAIDHSGVAEADAVFVKTKTDYENGRKEYEIEFYSGNMEYDYDIDAVTGNITGYDQEIETRSIPAATSSTSSATAQRDIGEAKAKELALAKVSGATNENIRIKQDFEDGRLVYEGEIIYGNIEYDFEIDASTGAFLEWSSESVHD